MEKQHFDDPVPLEKYLSQFGPRALFRGQTAHYLTPQGDPSLITSFGRQGCIPPLMHKWTFYAEEILRKLQLLPEIVGNRINLLQALLQHYGWRSFYIDFSNTPGVAAWFAAHRFKMTPTMCLCNDCFDESAILVTDYVKYEPWTGDGNIYVINRSRAAMQGVFAYDLSSLATDQKWRFSRQAAWLLGPFRQADGGRLDPRSIVAHVTAPAKVLAELAAKNGISSQLDLFPSAKEDPILAYLEAIPWEALNKNKQEHAEFPVFVRGLRIPKYTDDFIKRQPSNVAMYTEFWISSKRPRKDHPANIFKTALFIKAPEAAYFRGVGNESRIFPRIKQLLERHQCVIIEISNLIRLPGESPTFYTKGVIIHDTGNGLISVDELVVDHPGMACIEIGLNRGWAYRWEGDRLLRNPSPDDCTCQNGHRHEQHIGAMLAVEWTLNESRVRRQGKRVIRVDADFDSRPSIRDELFNVNTPILSQ